MPVVSVRGHDRVLEGLASNTRWQTTMISSLATHPMKDRLVLRLLELVDSNPDRVAGKAVTPKISQPMLASMIGVSRENVNRALSALALADRSGRRAAGPARHRRSPATRSGEDDGGSIVSVVVAGLEELHFLVVSPAHQAMFVIDPAGPVCWKPWPVRCEERPLRPRCLGGLPILARRGPQDGSADHPPDRRDPA